MKENTFTVLVLGSHPISGYSMLNFSRDTFEALSNHESSFEYIFLQPKVYFNKLLFQYLPKKISVYLDKFLLFGPYVWWICIRKRPKIVHVLDHSDACYKFYIPSGPKFIITVHDLFAIEAAKNCIPNVKISFSGTIYQKIIMSGLKRADFAICITLSTQQSLFSLFPNLKSSVVHNFIIPSKLQSLNLLQSQEKNYFLILMNSHWRKNRFSSIGVWKELLKSNEFKESSLVIVGNPLTLDEIYLLGHENLAKVLVHENLSRKSIMELYVNAIAVINISKYEGFGMPIIEANYHKKICIYGGSAAFLEIAPPQNINWAEANFDSPSKLIQKLLSIEAAEAAHAFVRMNYNEKLYAHKVVRVYRDLM